MPIEAIEEVVEVKPVLDPSPPPLRSSDDEVLLSIRIIRRAEAILLSIAVRSLGLADLRYAKCLLHKRILEYRVTPPLVARLCVLGKIRTSLRRCDTRDCINHARMTGLVPFNPIRNPGNDGLVGSH